MDAPDDAEECEEGTKEGQISAFFMVRPLKTVQVRVCDEERR